MSDTVEAPNQPVITRQQAEQAILSYFLANADAGSHAANDELIAELARRQRRTCRGSTSPDCRPAIPDGQA